MDNENLEQKLTSTPTKLFQHLDRLTEIQDGVFRPIELQFSPTDYCNLDCVFCSVKERDGGSWKKEDIEEMLPMFVDMGIGAIEITGGGDPTMYTGINWLIEYCDDLGLDIGMISNGLQLHKVTQENLDRLTWLRVSLSGLDKAAYRTPITSEQYQKNIDKYMNLPKIKGTLGMSYVWNKESDYHKIALVQNIANRNNAEFVRIVPDCLTTESQQKAGKEVHSILDLLEAENMFYQTKPYDVHKPCEIGYIKPFLNSDGYLYHCSALPLLNRKFDKYGMMGHWKEAKEIWANPKPYRAPGCEKGKCFFSEQNKILEAVQADVPHKNFV